ncbi:hypothetical protein [Candidatus Bealeia paramacronuclearis]|uniref:hypothetical protein n=1 Tax=Candidatus Bealeia paramacronuclearis TaxID=1921001 RepID=UPI0030D243C2
MFFQPLNAVQPFKHLEKDETPTGTYVVQFKCKATIEAKKTKRLHERGLVKFIDSALTHNQVKTGDLQQKILIVYVPHRYGPHYTLPKNFPSDVGAWIAHYFGLGELQGYGKEEDWQPHPKGFGYIAGPLKVGSHAIGKWESELVENKNDFRDNLVFLMEDIQHQGILKTCQKNPELILVIDMILHGTKRQVQTYLTPESAREIANLLAAIFDGIIENLSEVPHSQAFKLILSEELKDGVKISITVRDKTTKPQDHKKWARQTRLAFQTFFHNSKISLTSDKTALEIVRGK